MGVKWGRKYFKRRWWELGHRTNCQQDHEIKVLPCRLWDLHSIAVGKEGVMLQLPTFAEMAMGGDFCHNACSGSIQHLVLESERQSMFQKGEQEFNIFEGPLFGRDHPMGITLDL